MPASYMLDEMREQPELAARLLREQPEAIERVLAGSSPVRRLWFIGCGDMRFAGRLAAVYARSLGLEAAALPAMDMRWERERLRAGDLVVAASVSGRTPRTIEAARAARRGGATVLAITDDGEAPLAREANGLLVLNTSPLDQLRGQAYAGYARPVPQTKTFLAALITETLLAEKLAKRSAGDWQTLPDALEQLLADSERVLPDLVHEQFAATRWFCLLGSGPFAALASYGAAKLLEYAFPAHAQCLEEFQHLEMFVADRHAGLIILAPDQPSTTRALEITTALEPLECRSLVIGLDAAYPSRSTRQLACAPASFVHALVGMAIPLQRIAYEIARQHGRDVNAWVGGVRGELILRTSQATVRSSRIEE